jgi:hypothetical protein
MGRLLQFLELPGDDAMIAHAVEAVDVSAAGRWEQRNAQELDPIRPVLDEMLHQLGYLAESAPGAGGRTHPNMAG